MTGSLWIDVEDLFEYAVANPRPSGIQRLAFEIYNALQAHDGGAGKVKFLRHVPKTNGFRIVPWPEVAALFASLTEAPLPKAPRLEPIRRHGLIWRLTRRLVQRLPAAARLVIIEVLLTNVSAARAWRRLASTLVRACLMAPLSVTGRRPLFNGAAHESFSDSSDATAPLANDAAAVFDDVNFATATAPGDVVLVLGSPWSHPNYPGLIRNLRKKHDLRFAMLIYDLIPLLRPEWCDRGLVRLFREWFMPMLPLCDHVFAISKSTAADVEAFATRHGIILPHRVAPIPIGTGLSNRPSTAGPSASGRLWEPAFASALKRELPAAGSYTLVVSTIEARKNHLLLFRVWRRLLEDLSPERVPTLVFAGRVGWLVQDLMHQIGNTSHLDGKLVIVESPTDAELTTLYNGCLFTLFPSFYEGWGLPVTESLALGKPCLISDRTSLPEAGGTLARSFDPDNLNDAYAKIRNVIEDRDDLARWEAQVRRAFKPVPWSATAEALLAELAKEHPPAFSPSTSLTRSEFASASTAGHEKEDAP